MIGTTQKAQSPAATGLSANENSTPEILDASKREANLFARFALKGAAVHRLADGGYVVCQWSLSRAVPDLPALAAFGRMMGVI
ncbi:MAG: hypothetical protein J0H16_07350 [Alicycliphilus denitrificans]|nr:hypothetical protein [Alicycliphilus denitrificans]